MSENDQYYEDINSDDMNVGEDYFYDTYDRIIDTNRGDQDMDAFGELGPGSMGFAFALAESLSEDIKNSELNDDDENSHYLKDEFNCEFNVDENTDSENWEKVMKISSLQSRHNENSRIRPFEQYINDICRGRRPLFDT